MLNFDPKKIQTPCFVVDKALLNKNLEILKSVKDKTGAKILLAQKAFSMFSLYGDIAKILDGTTASGLFEAKLGHDCFGKETHIFSPAYSKSEFDGIASICGHIVFNSFSQFEKFSDIATNKGAECGLRINPEFSTQEGHDIYDPCAYGSRLGTTLDKFPSELPKNLVGLHFHTLCEQNSDDLEKTLNVVEEKFGTYLHGLKWLNFGGGHHITRDDYDIEKLCNLINYFKKKYDLQIYLEPGEAVVLNAGFLVGEVLEFVDNGIKNAILDVSAACHMPDVLEMPYRPYVVGSGKPDEKQHTYRFGGATCLAGDIIGDYSFDTELLIGDKLVFTDMALYTMVKTNTFNGMNLPSIAICDNGQIEIVKKFGYEDFKNRLS